MRFDLLVYDLLDAVSSENVFFFDIFGVDRPTLLLFTVFLDDEVVFLLVRDAVFDSRVEHNQSCIPGANDAIDKVFYSLAADGNLEDNSPKELQVLGSANFDVRQLLQVEREEVRQLGLRPVFDYVVSFA